ncbi:hypothetical protein [Stutzerimonas stutzeri]|uniref:hypothetical protein n=1 Tax=Stutzerimonas stutzeri TaxID=316 RepID=UPI001480C7E4|nr:hypothetical protein [Stutzerimonas stutzeri]WRQ01531.1 hypothetical protein U3Q39_013265 [Stutzerimonas stutzeri]
MDENSPLTVFICNTSLHIMNAMDACIHFGIEPAKAWLVIKTVPTASPESIKPVIALVPWGKTIWVGDMPTEGKGVLSFWRYQVSQYRYHRKWQQELAGAQKLSRVFISLNRMGANRIIANWLAPREVVWLDDGTLSYALALDSVLPPVKARPPSKTGNAPVTLGGVKQAEGKLADKSEVSAKKRTQKVGRNGAGKVKAAARSTASMKKVGAKAVRSKSRKGPN